MVPGTWSQKAYLGINNPPLKPVSQSNLNQNLLSENIAPNTEGVKNGDLPASLNNLKIGKTIETTNLNKQILWVAVVITSQACFE